jgi:dTMP kinase
VASCIALVGIDGSGKTTQALLLTTALELAGVPARYGPNPGGRRWLSRAARRLGTDDPTSLLGRRGLLLTESVLRWLAIARSLTMARLTGKVAIMDRYTVCQRVSLRVHGAGPWLTKMVTTAYRIFPEPTLLVLLDIPPIEAQQRIERRGTDHEDLAFLMAGSAAYRELAVNALWVDASLGETQVAQAVWAAVGNGDRVRSHRGKDNEDV